MTKEEKRKIEEEKEAKLYFRRDLFSSLENVTKDLASAERYLKMNGKQLELEERKRIVLNYSNLHFIFNLLQDYDKNQVEDALCMFYWYLKDYNGTDFFDRNRISIRPLQNDFIINNSFWNMETFKISLDLLLKSGYERIFYLNASTLSMENLVVIMSLGGVILEPIYDFNARQYGLIIDISKCQLKDYDTETRQIEEIVTKDLDYNKNDRYLNFGEYFQNLYDKLDTINMPITEKINTIKKARANYKEKQDKEKATNE